MPVQFMDWITREYVLAHPEVLFLFGDNMRRCGLGGQARVMRGAPNAIGVPTKHAPSMDASAFFTDADADNAAVVAAIQEAFSPAVQAVAAGRVVVIPAAGLGTGLAQLPQRAPRVHALIEQEVLRLLVEAGQVLRRQYEAEAAPMRQNLPLGAACR